MRIYTKDVRLEKSAMRDRLCTLQNGLCFYCQQPMPLKSATIDHLVPAGRGGRDVFENYVAACQLCNNAKGHRLPTFEQRRRAKTMHGLPEASAPPAHVVLHRMVRAAKARRTALPTKCPLPTER
jgi:CRISPR/Cas system Type II protein with McrA/HNH and RuvC-like nuclease domain